MFIINPYRYATAGASTYLDDLATQPRCVLSLKKLISTATSAIRVRRSSDNAEMDVGFVGDTLDTSTMLAWSGSDSAYIVKIYDQTGNGEDAVQATTAKQPRIVNAGSYDGKVIFSGAQGMKVASLTLGTPYVGIYSEYCHVPDASGTQIVAEMTPIGSSNSGTFIIYTNAGSSFLDCYNSGSGTNDALSMVPMTSMAQQTYLMDRTIASTSELAVFLNGSPRSATNVVFHDQTGNFLTDDLYLGARAESSLFSTIQLITFVIYNADSSGIRASVEAIVA